jgi:hypothetical protein
MSAKSSGILSNSSADIIASSFKHVRNGAKTELRNQKQGRQGHVPLAVFDPFPKIYIYSDYSRFGCTKKKTKGQFRILRK